MEAADWETAVRRHSVGVVPQNAWNSTHDIDGTPLVAAIVSVDLSALVARSAG